MQIDVSELDRLSCELNNVMESARKLPSLEKAVEEMLSKIKPILYKGGTTGDDIKDICILVYGKDYSQPFEKMHHIRNILKQKKNEYLLINTFGDDYLRQIDTSDPDGYRYKILPFSVTAIGIISDEPLTAGERLNRFRPFLKLNFQNGKYIIHHSAKVYQIVDAIHSKNTKVIDEGLLHLRNGSEEYKEGEIRGKHRTYWRIPLVILRKADSNSSDIIEYKVNAGKFYNNPLLPQEQLTTAFALYAGDKDVLPHLAETEKIPIETLYEHLLLWQNPNKLVNNLSNNAPQHMPNDFNIIKLV